MLLALLPAGAFLLTRASRLDQLLVAGLRLPDCPRWSYPVLQTAWLTMLGALVLTLAGLQTQRPTVAAAPQGGPYAFLVDVSASMAARESPSAPSNLEIATAVMSELVAALPDAQIQIFSFAGLAFSITDPTSDANYLQAVIEDGVYVESVPAPGSNIANALGAVALAKTSDSRTAGPSHAVLLSDGNQGAFDRPELERALQTVHQSDITVLSVGVGSEAGQRVPIMDASGGFTGRFAQQSGQAFVSSLQAATLRDLAERTGGRYFHSADTDELIKYLQAIRMGLSNAPGRPSMIADRDLGPALRILITAVWLGVLLLSGRLY